MDGRETEALALYSAYIAKFKVEESSHRFSSTTFLADYGLTEEQIDRFVLWSQYEDGATISVEQFVRGYLGATSVGKSNLPSGGIIGKEELRKHIDAVNMPDFTPLSSLSAEEIRALGEDRLSLRLQKLWIGSSPIQCKLALQACGANDALRSVCISHGGAVMAAAHAKGILVWTKEKKMTPIANRNNSLERKSSFNSVTSVGNNSNHSNNGLGERRSSFNNHSISNELAGLEVDGKNICSKLLVANRNGQGHVPPSVVIIAERKSTMSTMEHDGEAVTPTVGDVAQAVSESKLLNGRHVFAGYEDGRVRVWDVDAVGNNVVPVRTIGEEQSHNCTALVVVPKKLLVVFGDDNGSVHAYDLSEDTERHCWSVLLDDSSSSSPSYPHPPASSSSPSSAFDGTISSSLAAIHSTASTLGYPSSPNTIIPLCTPSSDDIIASATSNTEDTAIQRPRKAISSIQVLSNQDLVGVVLKDSSTYHLLSIESGQVVSQQQQQQQHSTSSPPSSASATSSFQVTSSEAAIVVVPSVPESTNVSPQPPPLASSSSSSSSSSSLLLSPPPPTLSIPILPPDGPKDYISCFSQKEARLFLPFNKGPQEPKTFMSQSSGAVRCSSLSPDATLIATGGDDCCVQVWEVLTGQQVGSLDHSGGIVDMAWARVPGNDDVLYLMTGCSSGEVKQWEISKSASEMVAPKPHSSRISAVAVDPLGEYGVSGCHDGIVSTWSMNGGKVQQLGGHGCGVLHTTISLCGLLIATASADGSVKLWDAHQGTCTATLTGPEEESAEWCAFTPDSKYICVLYSGNEDNLKLYSVPHPLTSASGLSTLSPGSSKVMFTNSASCQSCWFAVMHPNGSLLAVVDAEDEEVVHLWCLPTGHSGGKVLLPDVQTVAMHGEHLVMLTLDGHVRLYDLNTLLEINHFDTRHRMHATALFSPSGDYFLLYGHTEFYLFQVDKAQGELHLARRIVNTHEGEIVSAAFTLCNHVVTAGEDGVVRVWAKSQRRVAMDFKWKHKICAMACSENYLMLGDDVGGTAILQMFRFPETPTTARAERE